MAAAGPLLDGTRSLLLNFWDKAVPRNQLFGLRIDQSVPTWDHPVPDVSMRDFMALQHMARTICTRALWAAQGGTHWPPVPGLRAIHIRLESLILEQASDLLSLWSVLLGQPRNLDELTLSAINCGLTDDLLQDCLSVAVTGPHTIGSLGQGSTGDPRFRDPSLSFRTGNPPRGPLRL